MKKIRHKSRQLQPKYVRYTKDKTFGIKKASSKYTPKHSEVYPSPLLPCNYTEIWSAVLLRIKHLPFIRNYRHHFYIFIFLFPLSAVSKARSSAVSGKKRETHIYLSSSAGVNQTNQHSNCD